ncbi:MAG: hypothetical protein ABSB30_02555 [Terracidiphilus sp.]|jgi:hypothetical protein
MRFSDVSELEIRGQEHSAALVLVHALIVRREREIICKPPAVGRTMLARHGVRGFIGPKSGNVVIAKSERKARVGECMADVT